MHSGLARWRRQSPVARRAYLLATVLLPTFLLVPRVFGLQQRGANPVRDPKAPPSLSPEDIRDVVQAVHAAARHSPFPSTCLVRSLVLQWLLRRRGMGTELRIGVRLDGGRLAAHAWLEREGTVISDRPEAIGGFVPFGRSL